MLIFPSIIIVPWWIFAKVSPSNVVQSFRLKALAGANVNTMFYVGLISPMTPSLVVKG